MTWKLDEKTGIAHNTNGEQLDTNTGILTMEDGTTIRTTPLSEAAQKGAEEYLKVLESTKK